MMLRLTDMEHQTLRFLAADRVNTPMGLLADTSVVSARGETLGNLEGVLISPAERQARYFVVSTRRLLRTRRYLLPIPQSRIDAARHTVEVDVEADDLGSLPQMDEPVPSFSDQDLIDALFSSQPH